MSTYAKMKVDLLGATASDFQEMLDAGTLTSVDLVRQCHQQMLDHNGRLKAMISISPLSYTERVAKDLDKERQNGHRRSPLHGIPLIVKDSLDTTIDFGLQSTAGSWAFEDCTPIKIARVVEKAVEAGMILVGKANLSELGNWKGLMISGGWSARGGQAQSAYVKGGVVDDGIHGHSNPSGSSTGSAVAVSAGFAPVSIGADFNGSLTNPAIRAALYTIRTTPGTVSDAGGFPFSLNRDSVGPMAKSTGDLVELLNIITDTTHPNVPDHGYSRTSSREWKDISIATLDPHIWRLPEWVQKPQPGALDEIVKETQAVYQKLAMIVKRHVGPVDLMGQGALDNNVIDMMKLIKNDFSGLLDKYIRGLQKPKVDSLAELIQYNEKHRDLELPPEHPGQEKLIQSLEEANKLSKSDYEYLEKKVTAAGGEHGIDRVLREHNVDVIIGPADSRLPDLTALARCPSITLPLGYLDWNGRPFGLLAVASMYQEDLLLDVARAWEATFAARRVPLL